MPFQIVEFHYDKARRKVERDLIGSPLLTKAEAENAARHRAEAHHGRHGFNVEKGYWWAEDEMNRRFHIFVEPA